MSDSNAPTPRPLPERASLEYLKKLAKDRLRDMRTADPSARLALALLAIAREHGFASWRALKAEVERRAATDVERFFAACTNGDVDTVRRLVAIDPSLVARRDEGDNALGLHFAAGYGHADVVRALLDAGSDVHGVGDLHESEVIGWCTALSPTPNEIQWDIVPILIEHGAHHHIFSAIAIEDIPLIRRLIDENPDALDRRMSRFEQGMTALHYAIRRERYDILDLLIELGADLEAKNRNGETSMDNAIVRGDREAIARLRAAGADEPAAIDASQLVTGMRSLAGSTTKAVTMLSVADVAATLDWYASIGFTEIGRFDDAGEVNWGMLSFGRAELMLNKYGAPSPGGTALWFYTDKVDELYALLKSRQIDAARTGIGAIDFTQELYQPFYGKREFSLRDPNGYALNFLEE